MSMVMSGGRRLSPASKAALGFFGLSSADIVSWGRMLNAGQRFLFNAWWLSFFPGMAIFVTVLAFNLLGDAVGAALNPKTQKKGQRAKIVRR